MSEKQTKPVIRLDIRGSVAWLTLCRPERHNAMGMAFFKSLREDLQALDQDPAVRVVVICAEGKNFTVGLDLMEAGGILTSKDVTDRERLKRFILELQSSFNAIEQCRKPVIAAAHGYCIGGGVDLLSACDIRIASADACFSIRETRIAIIGGIRSWRDCEFAFLHPKKMNGALLELIDYKWRELDE
ncbi:enoyl-CoA hydratase/isomerase family protein [Desulfosarcina sp. OttesenSCG-928-B08]|nr:enoyl-CoA hydratase/isomerase family protein [Desulfosarcina sp. OttesenSCG-928-B08]